MKNTTRKRFPRRNPTSGVSLVELMVVMAVILIISVIALPNFIKTLRISQLNDGATQVANIIKLTRFTAIRRNTTISCKVSQSSSTSTQVWTDADGNGNFDRGESTTVITGSANLVAAASVPGTTSLAAAIGTNVVLIPVSLSGGTYTFDQRGATSPAGVYVSYLTYAGQSALGYRAVVVLPSGSMQTWTADSSGNWTQLN
jgi:prepilin-type N-terminal cleavage/methylation domain-containing protein